MAVKKGAALVSQADKKLLRAFGERVREVRERKELTVYDLTGDDMPIRSRQHWQRIEAGRKNINLTTVFKVAKCLEVRPEDLVKGLV